MRGDLRVVCVGDSVTFGEHLPSSERWPTLMAEVRPEWNVLMRGVNGDTTRLALERWHVDVQLAKPDVCFIQFGHNDANRWEHDNGLPRVSAGAYRWNLVEMGDRVVKFGGEPVIVVPHRADLVGIGEYVTAARWAAEHRGWSELSADRWVTPEHLLDAVHLNAVGHKLICGLALRLLEKLK